MLVEMLMHTCVYLHFCFLLSNLHARDQMKAENINLVLLCVCIQYAGVVMATAPVCVCVMLNW